MAVGCGRQSLRAQVQNSAPVLARTSICWTDCSTSSTSRSRPTRRASRCSAGHAKAGQLFLNDEISHAGDLAGLIRAAGGKPIKPAPSYALGHPRTSEEVLMLLHSVENAQIAGLPGRDPRLEPGVVKQQVASILANDAQHVAVVRAALGQPAIPSAFVTGRE